MHRSTRRRAAQRPPQGVALRAAWLLLGVAAVALVARAALAPGEALPADRSRPARVGVTTPVALPGSPPGAFASASPAAADVPLVAAAPAPARAPPPPGDRPLPGTERAFYEQDLQLAQRPGALAERARQLFVGGESSDPERVAALRALWDSATPGAEDWFAVALRPPPDAPAPRGALSVGEFALRFLSLRAAREPAALDLLTQLPSDATAPRALRRGAAVSVAAVADVPALRRLREDVATDDEPDFRADLARAAARNDLPEAAALFTSGEP
ncbi:MAG TPA: hypothetical protein VFY71_09950 [Planctomycetota bacterium]|nr:hypothetical protein [Planctomycetota bacterium]